MPTKYYESPKLPGLDKSEIGFEQTSKKELGFVSLIRTLVVVAELGLVFVPGINVATEVAIGLTGGAINEALDFATGNANVFSTFVNFGTPLIAGGFVGKVNRSISKGAQQSAKSLETILEGVEDAEKISILISSKLARNADEAKRLLRVAPALEEVSITSGQAFNNGRNVLINKVRETNIGLSRREARIVVERLASAGEQIQGVGAVLKQDKIVQRRILRTIGFERAEIEDLLSIINNLGLSGKQKYSAILGYIRNVEVLQSRRYDFKAFVKALESGQLLINEAYQLPLAKQLTRLASKNFDATNISSLKAKQSGQAQSFIQKFIKAAGKPGSRNFNDFIVQPTQAVFDANDAGRAPIEFLYRQAKKALRKSFSRTTKVLKEGGDIQNLFTKTGGVLVDSSWILGYKVINKATAPGAPQLIQISFQPRASYNKEPVFVFATPWEIEKFVLSPGNFYLNHWAYSRGGKRLGLGSFFGSGGLNVKGFNHLGRSVLGFLPISALRNILSIVSNIVENTSSMKEGKWSKEWKSKFVNSFRRSAINRSVRLFTREVISGGLSTQLNRRLSYSIGRELQRIGTSTLAPVLNNIATGKNLTTSLTKAKLANTFGIGIQSNLRRALRRQRGGSSVILSQLSARRKLQQLNRIPNAVVPKRPYKGIKIQKK